MKKIDAMCINCCYSTDEDSTHEWCFLYKKKVFKNDCCENFDTEDYEDGTEYYL